MAGSTRTVSTPAPTSAAAFEPTGNPEMDRVPYVDAKLVYRRRGDSAKLVYVEVLAQ
jgi:hypothetical protein